MKGIEVGKFVKEFKIRDISKRIEGEVGGGIGCEGIGFKVWVRDYGWNIGSEWVSELNCVGDLERIMSGFGGIEVSYNGYINENGNESVELNIRLGV